MQSEPGLLTPKSSSSSNCYANFSQLRGGCRDPSCWRNCSGGGDFKIWHPQWSSPERCGDLGDRPHLGLGSPAGMRACSSAFQALPGHGAWRALCSCLTALACVLVAGHTGVSELSQMGVPSRELPRPSWGGVRDFQTSLTPP